MSEEWVDVWARDIAALREEIKQKHEDYLKICGELGAAIAKLDKLRAGLKEMADGGGGGSVKAARLFEESR